MSATDASTAMTVDAAAATARTWGASSPAERVALLTSVADALDEHAEELIDIADSETHLGQPRLSNELRRTTFQLRLFADEVSVGTFYDVRIDRAEASWPSGPRPELRRYRTAVGPVLVFGASNFPFAFSVAGGDTAAAWAAGCPVVVKAHSGHPELAMRTASLVLDAVRTSGSPENVFALIEGRQAGTDALRHPMIRAASFTGSTEVGLMLSRIASERPVPIPFYGELGGVNPVVVTPTAAAARGEEIASEYVQSLTMGAGQFCTNPGLLFVPGAGDLIMQISRELATKPAAPMLTDSMGRTYHDVAATLRALPGVQAAVWPAENESLAPRLLTVDITTFEENLTSMSQECFGPLGFVVTYTDIDQLIRVIESLPGQLTTTLHAEPADDAVISALLAALSDRSGRVLWGGWPTGVAVSAAMQHGGPFPATTNSLTTSVGTAAIDRFLRPVTFQSWPDERLPEPLRDSNPWGVPQRVDTGARR